MKYTCPSCEQGFDRRTGSKCPNCGIELNMIRYKQGNKFRIRYELAMPETAPIKKAEPPPKPEPPSGLISHPDDIPEVYYLGKITKLIHGADREYDHYRVIYRGIVYTGFVVCPNCKTILWKNQSMDSGGIEQETICHKCKAVIAFLFITSSQWPEQLRQR